MIIATNGSYVPVLVLGGSAAMLRSKAPTRQLHRSGKAASRTYVIASWTIERTVRINVPGPSALGAGAEVVSSGFRISSPTLDRSIDTLCRSEPAASLD